MPRSLAWRVAVWYGADIVIERVHQQTLAFDRSARGPMAGAEMGRERAYAVSRETHAPGVTACSDAAASIGAYVLVLTLSPLVLPDLEGFDEYPRRSRTDRAN